MHASEQTRPDVAEARERWKAGQAGLDPARLVFIDETGTNTKMVRLYGRAPKGQRVVGSQPWGHWKTTTFVAGLRIGEITAPFVLDGPMNREAFEAYVEHILAPTLSEGDIVVMDNLPASTSATTRDRRSTERGALISASRIRGLIDSHPPVQSNPPPQSHSIHLSRGML